MLLSGAAKPRRTISHASATASSHHVRPASQVFPVEGAQLGGGVAQHFGEQALPLISSMERSWARTGWRRWETAILLTKVSSRP